MTMIHSYTVAIETTSNLFTVIGSINITTGLDDLSAYYLRDVTLKQELLVPQQLCFRISRNSVVKSADTVHFSLANQLIGKKVKVKAVASLDGKNPDDNKNELSFLGIITNATVEDHDIDCNACSLEAGLKSVTRCRCFMNMTLGEVVKSFWSGDGRSSNVEIHAPFDSLQIPYLVQYNESDYDFLVRLAKRFGAFFYFDQSKGLIFGKIPDSTPINLKYREDFLSVSYELQRKNINFNYAANHYKEKGDIFSGVPDWPSGTLSDLFKKAQENSAARDDKLKDYIDYPQLLPESLADDYLLKQASIQAGTLESQMVVCHCKTLRLDLHIGSIICFQETAGDNGKLVVISSKISWNCAGEPVNEITAIGFPVKDSRDSLYAPYFDPCAYPKSAPQRAVVFNNNDPKKLGRIQVLFVWQKAPTKKEEKEVIPWIRIAQPYSGNAQGCHILPEIGSEVMVGFEHQNMEKPFVIGTLFHDSSVKEKKQLPDDKWVETDKANKENEVKAFRTKKGHTIEFHDTKEGYGFIRIYGKEKQDQPNYDIILSTDKVQKVNGDNKEDYKVKGADEAAKVGEDVKEKDDYKLEKLRIMVRSNGGDIMLDASDGDIIMNAKNIRIHTTGNQTKLIEGNDILKVNGEQNIDVKSASLVVQKDRTIKVKGKETLEADSLSSHTSANTEIKGNNVDITANQNITVQSQKGLTLDGGLSSKLTANGGVNIESSSSVKVKATAGALLDGGSVTNVKGASVLIDATTGTRKGTWTDM